MWPVVTTSGIQSQSHDVPTFDLFNKANVQFSHYGICVTLELRCEANAVASHERSDWSTS